MTDERPQLLLRAVDDVGCCWRCRELARAEENAGARHGPIRHAINAGCLVAGRPIPIMICVGFWMCRLRVVVSFVVVVAPVPAASFAASCAAYAVVTTCKQSKYSTGRVSKAAVRKMGYCGRWGLRLRDTGGCAITLLALDWTISGERDGLAHVTV